MPARAGTPVWYAPLYGLMCGLLVMGAGLPPPAGIAMVALAIVSLGLLYQRWTQLSGLSVNGYRPGATRTIAVGLTVALLALTLAGLAFRREMGVAWAPVFCGIAAAFIAAFASAAWDRAWRDEIRRGEAGQ
jgi:hypothetical protein